MAKVVLLVVAAFIFAAETQFAVTQANNLDITTLPLIIEEQDEEIVVPENLPGVIPEVEPGTPELGQINPCDGCFKYMSALIDELSGGVVAEPSLPELPQVEEETPEEEEETPEEEVVEEEEETPEEEVVEDEQTPDEEIVEEEGETPEEEHTPEEGEVEENEEAPEEEVADEEQTPDEEVVEEEEETQEDEEEGAIEVEQFPEAIVAEASETETSTAQQN